MLFPLFVHKFFGFLSSQPGELFKQATAFIILFIITYMLVSEYLRNKEPQLKYLTYAFATLAIRHFFLTIIHAKTFWERVPLHAFSQTFIFADSFLETFALVWISIAFLYPLYENKANYFAKLFRYWFILLLAIFFIINAFWMVTLAVHSNYEYELFWGHVFFKTLSVLILLAGTTLIAMTLPHDDRYRNSIILAILVYLVTPAVQLVNIAFFSNHNSDLLVASQPFTILSILLFIRLIYLKLADKIHLKEQIEESQRKYLAEKEINQLKDKFISVVSHELRTPLTAMKLYLSLLKTGKFGNTTDEQKDALTIVENESNRLNHLLNDILDLSKLEAKKIMPKKELYVMQELFNDEIMYADAHKKNIQVIKKFPTTFTVRIDPRLFKRIIINLVNNATKFTDENGKITILTKETKHVWSFTIRDTGIGIPKEKIPFLFNKFYQVEDHMVRTQTGTGLGLAIVKELTELHNGFIEVTSQERKGTAFTLTFPKEKIEK